MRRGGIVVGLIAAWSLVSAAGEARGEASQPQPAASGESLQEIVVTAQRRSEKLNDVPISIKAITGEQMQKAAIGGTSSLDQVTPGLQFGIAGAYAQPTIRGIGTSVTAPGSDSNVAIYVDGVYMPNQNANIFDFSDVEQIEVLKGPQGTLYGRNATGGAINVTTKSPSADPSAKLAVSYGSFAERKATGFATGPIGDRLAGSLAYLYVRDDGYEKNVFDNTELGSYREYSGHGKLRWSPTERLTFVLAADARDSLDLRGYALKPLNGNVSIPNAHIPADPRQVALNSRPDFRTKEEGASITGTYDLGAVALNEITSWRRTTVDILTDLDRTAAANSSASFNVLQRTLTQEVNLASSDASAPLTWVAGAYYYNDNADEDNLKVNGAQSVDAAEVTSRSWAVYAQGDYKLAAKLTLTLGARYNYEKRGLTASRSIGAVRAIAASDSWNSPTYRAALRYELTNAANVYASWSTGFKSGTYNATSFSTTAVDPEKVTAYEVGYKYASGPVGFTAAAFYYDYKDIQVQAVTPSTGLTTLSNAARAESYGAEAQLDTHLTKGFTLTSGLAWTHGRYTSFPNALLTTPKTGGGNTQGLGDATGNVMIRTPEITANLGLTYTAPLWKGTLEASANEYYNSGYYWEAGNRLKQKAYQTLNGQIAWGPDSAAWRISVWARNLTDTLYELYVTDTTTADAVAYAPPRQVGVMFDLKL